LYVKLYRADIGVTILKTSLLFLVLGDYPILGKPGLESTVKSF
jgi:hypothetical protein